MSLEKIKTVTLADVSINNKGEYGIGASAVDYSDELYTYLRITDINDDGTLNKNDLKSVDDVDAKNYLLNENDVVFARTGNSTGKAYYYDKMDGELVYAGFLIKFSLDPSKINPKFMKYYVLSKDYKGWVNSMCTGSTRPNINAKMYGNMELILPPREQQDFLVNILGEIDNKIEINKRINKNLEELIKHIYINWFEDFEPFKGNTFHDTKLGKIPNGWNVKPLHKFIKFQEGPGIRNWQYVEEDGINFLNIRCIQNNDLILNTANMISKEEANGKYAHFMLNEWDLVISSSGTLGRYAIVRKEHLPLCLNTSIIRFKPLHSINHYAYIYSYLTSRGFYHYLLTMGSGSVQLNFGPTHLKQIDLIVPPEDVLKRYNETVFPIIEKIVKIKAEINKLTKLRDTLLPKLMSGEIDVSKINCDLE
ncbi:MULTISPECIES: restriction endonuclease subunit S [Methanobrevibacter]|uniref:restriction endonuclease subunit S n=1 Tax=Methanobrevibacter TaxID=2172 RepID=UPI000B986782|nr:restriction endonuclease subunit S [Methanobrevibacter smithii]